MRASNPSDGADRRPPEEDASATARRGAAARPPRPIEEDRPADAREVGVGPWPGGRAAWPDDPRYDPALLEAGDRRNVVDRFRYWRVEAVRAELASRAHALHVAIENVSQDLNIGSIVRTANAFNVAAVHVVGRRRWNRRGAMVTDRYLDVRHHADPGSLLQWASGAGYEVVALDNGPGSALLEGAGVSDELRAACSRVLRIGQYGSTRSINVAAAAAVAMHAWILQHGGPAPD